VVFFYLVMFYSVRCCGHYGYQVHHRIRKHFV